MQLTELYLIFTPSTLNTKLNLAVQQLCLKDDEIRGVPDNQIRSRAITVIVKSSSEQRRKRPHAKAALKSHRSNWKTLLPTISCPNVLGTASAKLRVQRLYELMESVLIRPEPNPLGHYRDITIMNCMFWLINVQNYVLNWDIMCAGP